MILSIISQVKIIRIHLYLNSSSQSMVVRQPTWCPILFCSCNFHTEGTITSSMDNSDAVRVELRTKRRSTRIILSIGINEQKCLCTSNGWLATLRWNDTVGFSSLGSVRIIRLGSEIFILNQSCHVTMDTLRKENRPGTQSNKNIGWKQALIHGHCRLAGEVYFLERRQQKNDQRTPDEYSLEVLDMFYRLDPQLRDLSDYKCSLIGFKWRIIEPRYAELRRRSMRQPNEADEIERKTQRRQEIGLATKKRTFFPSAYTTEKTAHQKRLIATVRMYLAWHEVILFEIRARERLSMLWIDRKREEIRYLL